MHDENIKKRLDAHRDYISKRIILVAFRNYTQLLPYFTRLLRKTRIPLLKRNGFWLGMLQIGMLKYLPKLQEETRKIQVQLKSKTLSEKREDLEHKLLIYQEWIRVLQTIIDGIAWRVLDFDRPVLRLLSENEGPGYISQAYAKTLTRFLGRWSDIIIINDLTRCIRIGDITRVTKNGNILLYELKKDGAVVMGMSEIFEEVKKHGPKSIGRQRHRHWTAQMSIVNRSIDIPLISSQGTISNVHRAKIVDSDISIATHFADIKELIKKANKTGFEQQELEDGYYAEITAWDKIVSDSRDEQSDPVIQRKKEGIINRPSWCVDLKCRVIDLSSTESFHREGTQYTRNFTPQSVLPFSAKDCVRIMMGCLEIKIFLNIDHIKIKLENQGWKVRYIDYGAEGKTKKSERDLAGEFMPNFPNEDFFDLSRSNQNGTYRIVIPLTLILQMLSSYYQVDFLFKAINEGFNIGQREKPDKRNMTINFIHEKDVLV